jgi:hypothetical protein
MDVFKEFQTDERKENEGVWVELGDKDENGKAPRIKIARSRNPKYVKMFNRLMKPYKRLWDQDKLPQETLQKILIRTIAKTVLLDWEGLKQGDQELIYSEKEAIRLLTELKDFRDLIASYSSEMELFKTEQDEEAEKNSSGTSSGT